MTSIINFAVGSVPLLVLLFLVAVVLLRSYHKIGPTQVGLVTKQFGKKLAGDSVVAFNGEAGYQAELLRPGVRFKLWPLYNVSLHSQVQIPAGKIGVVISQVGAALPPGAKTAAYKPELGDFTDAAKFIRAGGQKGIQRPVLSPGSSIALHPVAFLVVTDGAVFGMPITNSMREQLTGKGESILGVPRDLFNVTQISPSSNRDGLAKDVVGIVRTLEGKPLSSGSIASRLGGYSDIQALENKDADESEVIELLLGDKNDLHNNFQDFQAFLDAGGEMGLQHDVLRYGAYNLNPFLVRVETAEMLVVNQGQAAVIKAYVGLAGEDTSGESFKFGQLVKPGHRGLWQTPLRTGKYAINPRIYAYEMVPTSILNLNWAEATSEAHNLDKNLDQITAKSQEGFIFKLDLQVQIHVADTNAPKVISTVGSMKNLVEDVLQAAVGNHFRDTLQAIPAIEFMQKRQSIQQVAQENIRKRLQDYYVETPGVYIQDVILPQELVEVLKEREIASQQVETLKKQQEAQMQRISTEKAKGEADQQAGLAASAVGIQIEKNKAAARVENGKGEAEYLKTTGEAAGAKIRAEGVAQAEALKAKGFAEAEAAMKMAEATKAQGLAQAEGMKAQTDALGQNNVMVVNVVKELVKAPKGFMPHNLVMGQGGSLDGVGVNLMEFLGRLALKPNGTELLRDSA